VLDNWLLTRPHLRGCGAGRRGIRDRRLLHAETRSGQLEGTHEAGCAGQSVLPEHIEQLLFSCLGFRRSDVDHPEDISDERRFRRSGDDR
jgi:hypothetical protein